jgi:hypothetical protein
VRLSSSSGQDSSSQPAQPPQPATAVVENKSFKFKLKTLWKTYGVLAVTTYLGVYVGTLSSIFLALDYDIFHAATVGVDPIAAIQKVCDLVEATTGNTALPGYIRENPRGE